MENRRAFGSHFKTVIPMNFGRYRVEKEIGKGSMGVVYQAHDPQIDRLVALKVLREDRVTSEAFVQRFLKEAKAIGRLSHTHIVTVYDVGQDHGTIYIAMEFLDGKPLNQAIKGKRFSQEEIVNLGIQVAETLDYSHQKGIIHRDVKPSNILFQSSGHIKITDFGIAHIEDPTASVQTQNGEILGTPAYMSPEQVMSRPADGRSDLFSLGIILYEIGTGKRPFEGENIAAIFNAITQEIPLEPIKINPLISQTLSKIIMKCLRKNPEERFKTGKELAEALKGCVIGKETIAVPPLSSRRKKILYMIFLIAMLAGLGTGVSYVRFIHRGKTPPHLEKIVSASLNIESMPNGAHVFVDGDFKGETPCTLDLPFGKHEIRLTLSDYYDWESQVQLEAGVESPLSVRLIPIIDKKS